MVRAAGGLPLLVEREELRAEGVAAGQRQRGAADGEVVGREPARFVEVTARGRVITLTSRVHRKAEVQTGVQFVGTEIADCVTRVLR